MAVSFDNIPKIVPIYGVPMFYGPNYIGTQYTDRGTALSDFAEDQQHRYARLGRPDITPEQSRALFECFRKLAGEHQKWEQGKITLQEYDQLAEEIANKRVQVSKQIDQELELAKQAKEKEKQPERFSIGKFLSSLFS